MADLAHVLVVIFVSIPQQGTLPPKYGVAMQEFASFKTCDAVRQLIESKDSSATVVCKPK
jgi:hypothetical protein